ncbi:uncharacterized protein C7orf50 homolog [Melanotaenia boesemani]|uniref:uncharacterized protein C7orf50 homolog n=1 Tax=Melanotaenia boesemani TaxID=1250792 RepID=UPI001C05E3A2|nr:uncharacterized protein C7orf50 homolog [Melanotaenia boesemani]
MKKSVKSESNLPKRKKLSSIESPIPVEEIMEIKLKKKRKHMKVEKPSIATTTKGDKKWKKDKKHKKKPADSKQQTEQTKSPDPSSYPERIHDPEEEGDQEEELSPEEKRVLERKMKKILKKEEKNRLNVEGKTVEKIKASEPTASQQALDYLRCWAENRLMWKFQKTRQTWLLQHMFDSEKVSEENFYVLLKYLEGLRGSAKDTTVQKALTLVEESGQTPEDTVVQQRAHRAREVIQLFS